LKKKRLCYAKRVSTNIVDCRSDFNFRHLVIYGQLHCKLQVFVQILAPLTLALLVIEASVSKHPVY
jgi:hypothetical protein